MENLARLKDWFAGTAPIIAEASLAAISGQDRFLDALFLRAVTAWRVAEVLVEACSMWSGGHDMTTILDEAPWPSDKDRRILPDIAPDRGMAAGRGGVRSGVGGRPARGAGLTTAMGRSEASSRPEQAASGTIGGPLGLDRDRPLSLCEAA